MPHAVTHVLVALVVADIIRDYIVKDKKRFPLHYVLIAGVAGLLPDIDVVVYWFLNIFLNIPLAEVHRTFSHTLFVPLLFFVLGVIFLGRKINFLAKRRMTISGAFVMAGLGTFIHLVLDSTLAGTIRPFYPLADFVFGINLIPYNALGSTLMPGLDAILLVVWLVHEEIKHKISDFI